MTQAEDQRCQPCHRRGAILTNDLVGPATHRLRLSAPALAEAIRPGQFVMLRLPDRLDPLLGRPFALYDIIRDRNNRAIAVDFIYTIFGPGTARLAQAKPGDSLDWWGPLGNVFPAAGPNDHVLIVAGGIGQTPFPAVIKDLQRQGVRKVTFLWGVRSAAHAVCCDDFHFPGVDVVVTSNDGSIGRKGFVTDVVTDLLQNDPPTCIFACGPTPMLRRLTEITAPTGIPCYLSLEEKMACGYGVCFSCVFPIAEAAGGWDYRRTCIEGPIFRADQLAWTS